MGDTDEQMQVIREFFESNKKTLARYVKAGKIIYVDFNDVAEHDVKLSENILERPEETIIFMEAVLEDIMWAPDDCRVRFLNIPDSSEVSIRNIRSKHLGTLLKVKGIVKRASVIRPQTTNIRFECPSCGTIISVLQTEKARAEPSRCSCGRRGGFKIISEDKVDYQLLSVEELQDHLDGNQPEKVKVYLSEDLVSPKNRKKVVPGLEVEIIGILAEETKLDRGGKKLNTHDLILQTNNVISLSEEKSNLVLSDEEEKQIREIAKSGRAIEKITHSIAPSIKGHANVKKSIAIQMFGGNRRSKKDGTKRRGDIHILLVSDPSMGKSVILDFVDNLSPKCRTVSGKSTSAAGLIGGAVKDEILGGWTIEAGAMAIMNGGHLNIDEFEKVSDEDRSSLHQAMEQQTVTIQKIVSATLRTETSILAAANPKYGRFDPSMDMGKQINMIPSLLSRFDVIYVLRDVPNEKKDSDIADIVLGEELEEGEDEVIEIGLLRKYISYAKKNIHPVLTKEATDRLKGYYISMRKINGDNETTIAIGTRQLEGMMRMAAAHAKMRLSEEIMVEDAQVAIDIMSDYLKEVGYDDETETFDIDKSIGVSSSDRAKMSAVIDVINKLYKQFGKPVNINDVYSNMEQLSEDEIDRLVEILSKGGSLFIPSRGYIKPL